MKLKAFKTELKEIQSFRNLFLQENNIQFICNAFHERGWAESYLFTADNAKIGYGSLCGIKKKPMNTVFEFYVIPAFRKIANLIFSEFLTTSQAVFIECQTNDLLLSEMLFEFAQNINTNVFLFDDHIVTNYNIPSVNFRLRKEDDKVFEHKGEPEGEYVLEMNGEIVATGGFLLNYNMPYADLYMEVKEEFRRKGLGSFLLQEVKKKCYQAGRVPAARCNITNQASKATIVKAGLKVCGFEVRGEIKNPHHYK